MNENSDKYLRDRWQEILDGKREWSVSAICAGDQDRFYTEYIRPLKELEARGLFEKLIEFKLNKRGTRHVVFLELEGAINLAGELEEP